VSAERLRVRAAASGIDALVLEREPDAAPQPGEGEIVVEVKAAAVNPSDVKATLGAMPHAIWPRTPGRDWAGVIVAGPADLLGEAVFGTGGELGISRDGSHARYLRLHRDAAVPKPAGMSLAEASALGVPFVTAYQGLSRAGLPGPGEIVLVLGVNGKVGQAATQIAAAHGARVFGVSRKPEPYAGHASAAVRMIDSSREDVAAVVRAETGGHGADIAYNTVGSPYFAAANAALARHGRQILIATIDRAVPFDILAFYRAQLTYVGIDSLALDGVACATILRELLPGFESGALRPFPVLETASYGLADAERAYRAVLAGASDRVVLIP
jgi:NADPH:quinone reductase-like Zn-dependent oxidoreductase